MTDTTTNATPADDEQVISEAEIVHDKIQQDLDNLIARVESTSRRMFGDASNYKKKLGMTTDAPGKKEFKNIAARVRKIKPEVTRAFKAVKPKGPKKAADPDAHTGFTNLKLLSPKLSAFMRLADWGLQSGADPTRCVCTHGRVTRYMTNYLECMDLYTKVDGKRVWVADDALRELFADDWEKRGVKPSAAKYTDVQKLLPGHMENIEDENATFENRNKEEYEAKLDDDSDFAKATGEVKRLRAELKEFKKDIAQRAKNVKHCERNRPGQEIGALFKKELDDVVAAYNKAAAELKQVCTDNNFARAESFPETLTA